MYARCGPALNVIPDAAGRRVSFIHGAKVYGLKFFKAEARTLLPRKGHFRLLAADALAVRLAGLRVVHL